MRAEYKYMQAMTIGEFGIGHKKLNVRREFTSCGSTLPAFLHRKVRERHKALR